MSDPTKPPARRDAVDLWNAAVAEAYAEDAPGLEAAGGDALDRELADEGFDLAEIEAMAAASFDAARAKHAAGSRAKVEPAAAPLPPAGDESQREPVWVADAGPSSNVVPLAPRRKLTVWLAYAVAAAAATGGAAYVAGHARREAPPPPPPVVEEPTPAPPAPIAPKIAPPVAPEAPSPAQDTSGKKAPR